MNLMSNLPNFYEENEDMKKLQNLLNLDVGEVTENLDKTIKQCFVNSADDLLSRFEKLYRIETDINKDINIRREAIKSKMAGTGTFTKSMLNTVLGTFEGGQANILEEFNNYFFKVKFNDYNRVPSEESIVEIYKILEEVKPAHLRFNHTFTYNWWNREEVKNKTWGNAGTWQDFRNYEEVI